MTCHVVTRRENAVAGDTFFIFHLTFLCRYARVSFFFFFFFIAFAKIHNYTSEPCHSQKLANLHLLCCQRISWRSSVFLNFPYESVFRRFISTYSPRPFSKRKKWSTREKEENKIKGLVYERNRKETSIIYPTSHIFDLFSGGTLPDKNR